jgi:hypothetical protein
VGRRPSRPAQTAESRSPTIAIAARLEDPSSAGPIRSIRKTRVSCGGEGGNTDVQARALASAERTTLPRATSRGEDQAGAAELRVLLDVDRRKAAQRERPSILQRVLLRCVRRLRTAKQVDPPGSSLPGDTGAPQGAPFLCYAFGTRQSPGDETLVSGGGYVYAHPGILSRESHSRHEIEVRWSSGECLVIHIFDEFSTTRTLEQVL